jgi:hypothetical protein
MPTRMEGGVAIILLLVIGVIVLVGGAILYLTGGAIGLSRQKGDGGSHRPEHKRPTDPVQENREFVGVHRDGDEDR